MSSQMATDAARERIAAARSEQKRSAARDFLKSAVMPLIEDVLVKKFCQTMDVIAEDNKRLKVREEGLAEALEDIGASWHGVQTELEKYMRNVARRALAAHRKQKGVEA